MAFPFFDILSFPNRFKDCNIVEPAVKIFFFALNKFPGFFKLFVAFFCNCGVKMKVFRIVFTPGHPLYFSEFRDKFKKNFFPAIRKRYVYENCFWGKIPEAAGANSGFLVGFAKNPRYFFYFFYVFSFKPVFQGKVGCKVFFFCNV
ncbi:MAG: hypothetical protein V1777_03575 [Candidatus Micrarchaeota archaeon]